MRFDPTVQVKQWVACVKGVDEQGRETGRFAVFETGDAKFYLFHKIDPRDGTFTGLCHPVRKTDLRDDIRRALRHGVGNCAMKAADDGKPFLPPGATWRKVKEELQPVITQHQWQQVRAGYWECWTLRRAEVVLLEQYHATLRHGHKPGFAGAYETLEEAQAACEAEALRQDAEDERRAEANAAFVAEILAPEPEPEYSHGRRRLARFVTRRKDGAT